MKRKEQDEEEEEQDEQEEDVDGEEHGDEGEKKGGKEMDDHDDVQVLSAHPGFSGPTPAELHDAIRRSPTAASSGLDHKRRELYEKMCMIKDLEIELGIQHFGWHSLCLNSHPEFELIQP